MRSREEILSCGERVEKLQLEVLLDIRDMLTTGSQPKPNKTNGHGCTCDVCGRQFSLPIALAGHKRSHK